MADRKFSDETLCLHAGQIPDQVTGSRAAPIYQTSSYVFDDAEHAASLFNLQTFGNVYSRLSNPTNAVLEERVAALEGGRAALAVSSGMSAQMIALLTLVNAGDEIVGNPNLNVLDIEAVAEIAHEHNIPLVLDNTVPSPYLCKPMSFGADIVVHSATKFIGGHGTSIGGLIVESGKFPWDNGKFPEMVDASDGYHGVRFYETFGDFAFITKARMEYLRTLGPSMSPFNAFLFLQGMETLHFLSDHPLVEWVNYPGLQSSKYYELAQKYMPNGASAVLTFGVKGGFEAAEKFIGAAHFLSHLANIGDAKSLIVHPASTTHRQLNEQQQLAAGVRPDMVRISVGLEAIDDILWDIDQSLQASTLRS